MAYIHTGPNPFSGQRLLGAIRRVFAAIGNMFVEIAETNARVRQIEKLNNKSDAQLAQLGLRREDIARHVFRDKFYI